jgi:isopenicillin N synthase-like dioxygenase
MNVETLETLGFVSVINPFHQQTLGLRAMRSWQDFCGLPLPTKLVFSGGDRVQDYGYMLRNDPGPASDRKEQFHLRAKDLPDLRNRAQGVLDPRAQAFIESVSALQQAVAPLLGEFATSLERAVYCRAGFQDAVTQAQDSWTFRFLHYFGSEMLAAPHFDRGGFTLHLYEDEEGGEYLGFDGVWRPWPVSSKNTIIFPSAGLQHYSECRLKALYHRVRSTPLTATAGRFAMVAFVDFVQPYRLDHRFRGQNFEPGSTYNMSFEEFSKFFIPS